MLFSVLVLIFLLAAWTLLAMIAWIAISLPRRARGALWAAPFAECGAVLAGVGVPLLGLDDNAGLALSMLAALIGAVIMSWFAYQIWDRCGLDRRFERLARRIR